MSDKIPVLLDTDPGSDIDDALAISYLLSQPRCDLLGISTVTGDTPKRAAIAEVLCNAAGKTHVPIVAGTRDVIAHGPGQPNVPQFDSIAHLPHKTRKPNEAVDFLRQTIRKNPHQITLLSIGPYTNIALLFALDPEIPSLLKGFVSMAGAFSYGENKEWNCVCDPVATAMVAKANLPHTWYGLDVTTKCSLTKDECTKRFTGPLLELVLQMAKSWFQNADRIIFHDPLATACLFHPEICEYKSGKVSVRSEDGRTELQEVEGSDRIAVSVNPQSFLNEFFGVIVGTAYEANGLLNRL